MRNVVVHTRFIHPPIPDCNHDWQATLDGWEPGEPIGFGPTEADAVYSLYIEIEMRELDEQEDDDQEWMNDYELKQSGWWPK